MNIGKSIKDIRKDLKVSQKILADKVEISETSVCNIEKNKNIPRGLVLTKISDSLNVSSDYILLNAIESSSVLPEDEHDFNYGVNKLKRLMNKLNNKKK